MSVPINDLAVLTRVAGMLSNQRNIDIRIGGDTASCGWDNGRYVISIPAVATDDRNFFTLVRGYIDHESAHARFTTFNLPAQDCYLMSVYTNLAEDVMVERKISSVYRGCGANFRAMASLLFDRPPPGMRFRKITADKLWHVVNTYAVLGFRSIEMPKLVTRLSIPKGILDKLLPGLADEMKLCFKVGENTLENRAIGEGLYNVVVKYLDDKARKRPKDGKADSEEAKLAERADDMLKHIPHKVDDVFADAINKLVSKLEKNGAHVLYRLSAGAKGCDIEPLWLGSMDVALSGRVSIALRSRIEGLLQAKRLRREWIGRSGRLDTRRLHRLAINDDRLFRRRVLVRDLNTEVIVLCDASGSMCGAPAVLTSHALYAIMLTLHNIKGVDSALYHFNGDVVACASPFKSRLTRKCGINANGGTLLGAAMLYCIQKFTPPDEGRRRILITLSDGHTGDVNGMPTVVRLAKKLGIECVNIGIMTDAMKQFDPANFRRIDTLDELPRALFDVLDEKLVRRAI